MGKHSLLRQSLPPSPEHEPSEALVLPWKQQQRQDFSSFADCLSQHSLLHSQWLSQVRLCCTRALQVQIIPGRSGIPAENTTEMNSLSQPPALEEFCCCFCLGEQLTGGRAVCTPLPARICSVGPLGGRTIQLGSPRFIQQNRNLSHNSFFLVSLKIFLFFPGKHKN